ncbi:MAG: ATP-binding cassette domain-containing protein [Firmicutes bacterium]|nr:ATP-binding cassette domain-containing protein [Bacillota bacterium]
MLKINNLSASYGHIEALRDVSIEAEKGQIVSIIGSNGAGKTTLLRCISGQVKPTAGTIEFLGRPLPSKVHKVVEKGVVHVPEGRRTF